MDDLTNRIMAVAFAFLFMFAVFLVILLVWTAPDESITRIRDLAGYLDDHNTTEAQLIITFGGVILMLLAMLLILFELVPPETTTLRVQQAGTGEAEISADEVVLQLEEELRALPQIDQAQATIIARGKKAEVKLSLHVGPDANLSTTVDAACQLASDVLENRMGIALAKPPAAEVHYRELRVGSQPSAPAGPPPQATDPPAEAATPAGSEPLTTQPAQESSDVSRDDPPASA